MSERAKTALSVLLKQERQHRRWPPLVLCANTAMLQGMEMRSEREAVIRGWMQRSRSEGGTFRYNDLHVDQIDPAWKSNRLWFDAAMEALQLAVMVRNELGWDLPLAVAFSLNAAEPEPRSREDLEQQMDWTPPSLYLFEKGKEFWAEISFQAPNVAEYKAIKLDRTPFGTALGTAHLVQFLRTDTGERVRSFIVTV